jgi:hypothetical protein
MDAATDYEVLGTFYRVVEGRETCGSMVEKQSTASGVLQCFRFRQRRGACRADLISRVEGRPEDAAVYMTASS